MTLRTIYLYVPARLRRLGVPALACYRFFRGLRVELWGVQGEECHSGLPLSVLCALPSQERSYLARLMFGDSFREHCLGKVWFWNISKAAQKAGMDYSMTLVKINAARFRSWADKDGLSFPSGLKGRWKFL